MQTSQRSAGAASGSAPFAAQDYIDLETVYGADNYHPLDVVITKGQGVWVWDIEENQYLACLSAYSALNQGHCHPRILQALVDQAAKVTLTSRAFRNDQLELPLVKRYPVGSIRFLPLLAPMK